jgi:uncharacterized protein YuzE
MKNKKGVRKTIEDKQDYDVQNDTLFIYMEDYDYKKSIRMDKDFILDLDKNFDPVALEILHASKVFNINNKFHLTRPMEIDINIDIDENTITIEGTFIIQIRQREEPKPVKAEAANLLNLPVQDMRFATA